MPVMIFQLEVLLVYAEYWAGLSKRDIFKYAVKYEILIY